MLIFYGIYIAAMNWCGKGAVGSSEPSVSCGHVKLERFYLNTLKHMD